MNPEQDTVYSMDTGAFIDGLDRYYRSENFPTLWEHFKQLIEDERVFASDQVLKEIESRDEFVKQWIDTLPDDLKEALVKATNTTIMLEVREIQKNYSRLVVKPNSDRADPFVIATAKIFGATVVTSEKRAKGSRPKIPDVCDDLNLACISFADLIRNEGWVF